MPLQHVPRTDFQPRMRNTAVARRVTLLLPMLFVGSCGGDGDGDDIRTYDCSVFPAASTSPYILPYGVGQSFRANPHAAREAGLQQYAVDIVMPIGTEVLASRAGVVLRLEEGFVDGDNVVAHENYVMVRHDDGSVARYVHLTQNGSVFAVGDAVRQGEIIGYSGNTGNSTGPHLHFDVVPSCCNGPARSNGLTDEQTVAVNFRNATPSGGGDLSCGLRIDVFYTAGPIFADV